MICRKKPQGRGSSEDYLQKKLKKTKKDVDKLHKILYTNKRR